MEYPTPDAIRCRVCGHGYWQYPDRSPGCPRCHERERDRMDRMERENKELRKQLLATNVRVSDDTNTQ